MCVLQGNNQTIEEIENGRSKEKNVEDEKTSADCGEQLRGRSGELLRELRRTGGPHTVCKHCGTYKGRQILTVEQ